MIPYPCWLLSASAVRIRNVASCIARSVILTLYTVELSMATRPSRPAPAVGSSRKESVLCTGFVESGDAGRSMMVPRAIGRVTAGLSSDREDGTRPGIRCNGAPAGGRRWRSRPVLSRELACVCDLALAVSPAALPDGGRVRDD